jgi:ATPase subunit of ABC transporter with duplicated ATPase domains
MRVDGGRTGKVAFRARGLAITGIIDPFDAEVRFGERVGVIGPNGTGKSHFLRLLAGEEIGHEGEWMLGARVDPALFAQLHERPDIGDLPILEVLMKKGIERSKAHSALRRYELDRAATNPFGLLSGGSRRASRSWMELTRRRCCCVGRADGQPRRRVGGCLERALDRYEGTVIAVTHDRWFMRQLDRFLWFDEDGTVRELLASPYDLAMR